MLRTPGHSRRRPASAAAGTPARPPGWLPSAQQPQRPRAPASARARPRCSAPAGGARCSCAPPTARSLPAPRSCRAHRLERCRASPNREFTLSGVSVVLLHARHLTVLERARQCAKNQCTTSFAHKGFFIIRLSLVCDTGIGQPTIKYGRTAAPARRGARRRTRPRRRTAGAPAAAPTGRAACRS